MAVCGLCKVKIDIGNWGKHTESELHKNNAQIFFANAEASLDLIQDYYNLKSRCDAIEIFKTLKAGYDKGVFF